jgi:SAM-dependent methyltransferase
VAPGHFLQVLIFGYWCADLSICAAYAPVRVQIEQFCKFLSASGISPCRVRNESLRESIRRHEHFLALKLGLRQGDRVLDVGCGIGGPLREIAIFRWARLLGKKLECASLSRPKPCAVQVLSIYSIVSSLNPFELPFSPSGCAIKEALVGGCLLCKCCP